MIFNSIEFIYIFLPLALAGYFLLNFTKQTEFGKWWLVLASLFYFGYASWPDIFLLCGSIVLNYIIGKYLLKKGTATAWVLVLGVTFNIISLGYFKYTNFIISNVNQLFSLNFTFQQIVFPLAISFVTFQQIAFLVHCFKAKIEGLTFVDYCLFVTFFPKLFAGPIVYYSEFSHQFSEPEGRFPNYRNISIGVVLFAMGLFKKTVLADSLTVLIARGFSNPELNFIEAWSVALAFSMKLYFDFSGYMDMALGISRMFNVEIPLNFNSPYLSTNIKEFWRRWHITLGRANFVRIQFNLIVAFMLVGIWHGAAWSFVAWGLAHGVAMVVHRVWMLSGKTLPRVLSIFITFLFVNFAWVLFRAENFSTALKVWVGMLGMNGFGVSKAQGTENSGVLNFVSTFVQDFMVVLANLGAKQGTVVILFLSLFLSFYPKNSAEVARDYNFHWGETAAILITAAMGLLMLGREEDFIYFRI